MSPVCANGVRLAAFSCSIWTNPTRGLVHLKVKSMPSPSSNSTVGVTVHSSPSGSCSRRAPLTIRPWWRVPMPRVREDQTCARCAVERYAPSNLGSVEDSLCMSDRARSADNLSRGATSEVQDGL